MNKLETGYNFVLKFHRPYQTTYYTEKMDHLEENQWDTCSKRSVDTIALLDKIITEIFRLWYRSLAKLQNDTAAYFDRMIRNIINLCSHHHHVPDSVCLLLDNVLRNIQYKILTSHGTFKKKYSHSTDPPLHGSGQKIESAATNWTSTSILVIRVIETTCTGFSIISPNQQYNWEKHTIRYVDDKLQYSDDWNNNKLETVIK